MGLLTFATNVTLDGCVDHREGIADDETHDFFTRLMDESGAMLWGRVTYEMMESYWPAVARGAEEAPPAMREWAVKLEAKPKYVVSSTRKDFPWTNSHHIGGDLRAGVQRLKDATPKGVLLGSGKLATELDRLELIDEYKFLVHPRLAGHGPSLELVAGTGTRRAAPAAPASVLHQMPETIRDTSQLESHPAENAAVASEVKREIAWSLRDFSLPTTQSRRPLERSDPLDDGPIQGRP
jgi:dihydrofolate reductase